MSSHTVNAHWFSSVQAAFPDHELCSRIWTEGNNEPTRLPRLFEDISRYVLSLHAQQTQHPTPSTQEVPTNLKKRKFNDDQPMLGSTEQNGAATLPMVEPVIFFECKDVSVQIPARKKLKVQLVSDSNDKRRKDMRLLNSTTNDLEYTLSAEEIDQVFCLPVPDKQQRQSYFAVIPTAGATNGEGMPVEPVLFTLNETSPASLAISAEDNITTGDNYITVTQQALARFLSPFDKRVTTPDPLEFASAKLQSHRKGEKAYHVNAHRGSKEGYLFFLTNGILFGFKKPLAFFPFSSIEAISYTSVLQRTFNLVISTREGNEAELNDTEFSMLDQEDFAGIDEYVKRHGLNDASMAAERRAKAYNVNKERKAETNGEEAGTKEDEQDGQTELQKAEQQLQDEEDEEEEDYEASGGESDGEGVESEEDDEEYGDEYDEEGDEETPEEAKKGRG